MTVHWKHLHSHAFINLIFSNPLKYQEVNTLEYIQYLNLPLKTPYPLPNPQIHFCNTSHTLLLLNLVSQKKNPHIPVEYTLFFPNNHLIKHLIDLF